MKKLSLKLSQLKDDFYNQTKFSDSKADEDNVKLGNIYQIHYLIQRQLILKEAVVMEQLAD